MPRIIYDSLEERFPGMEEPEWYPEAVEYLRGNADRGLFGLYLYYLVRDLGSIESVVNIGTARGHSAVCLAKGLASRGGEATVHTLDLIPPDEPIDWHVPKQPDSDPATGTKFSMRELVTRFQDEDSGVDIQFHTGDSNDLLDHWEHGSPDLVFHDAEHTYEAVNADIRMMDQIGSSRPIHVFDDCYLYNTTLQRHLVDPDWYSAFESLPRAGGTVGRVARNKSRDLVRKLTWMSLVEAPYPGVARAVREAYESGHREKLEVVEDDDHSPITTIY